jgi:beta-mannosidase
MAHSSAVETRVFNDTESWSWKQRELSIINVIDEANDVTQGWKRVSSMPSDIHVELLKIGAIPDPYIGFNEHKVQCKK